jgi:hypothetical protein
MPAPLWEDARQYLRDHPEIPMNAETLNWAMERLQSTPGLRPSYRMQGAGAEDQIAQAMGAGTQNVAPVGRSAPTQNYSPQPNPAGAPVNNISNTPMPKPGPQGVQGEFSAGGGKVAAYLGGGRAGYVDPSQIVTDVTGKEYYAPYYDEKFGANDARIMQEMMPQAGGGMGGNPANAGEGAPAEGGSFWDMLTGMFSGPTVNETVPPPGPRDPALINQLIQSAAGAAVGGGNGGSAAAGLTPRGPSSMRPPMGPGPEGGGFPPPAPRGGPSAAPPPSSGPQPGGVGTAKEPPLGKFYKEPAPSGTPQPPWPNHVVPGTKITQAPPKSGSGASKAPKEQLRGDPQEYPDGSRAYRDPNTAPKAPPKKTAPKAKKSTQEDIADKMTGDKPKSRMKDMTDKSKADAAEKSRMDKLKGQGRAKKAYDKQRKGS